MPELKEMNVLVFNYESGTVHFYRIAKESELYSDLGYKKSSISWMEIGQPIPMVIDLMQQIHYED